MIRKKLISKILVSTVSLFLLLLIYLIPKDNYKLSPKQQIEYVNEGVKTSEIYLLNDNNLLARTSVAVKSEDTKSLANEILNILIIGGEGESVIPSGFKAVLPSDIEINNIDFYNGTLKVDFSKEILNVSKEQEQQSIESIVYSLTEIKDVNNIMIYVEGKLINNLANNLYVPDVLTRKYGINKKYNINSLNNIDQVTIYYIDKYNDQYYYVPVTKYVNDSRDKIKIIIEDLASNKAYNSNLMSFLNSNTKLLSVQNEDNIMKLTFNNYILNDFDKKDILEEVIYTICLSIEDNYDVKEVVFNVDNEEIYKKVLKTIE